MALFNNKLKTFQEQAAQEKKELQAQIDQLAKEKSTLTLECVDLQAKVNEKTEVVEQVIKERQQLREQNENLQQIHEASQEIAQELRNQNEALEKQVALLHAQLAEREATLAQSQANENLLRDKYKGLRKVNPRNQQAKRPLKGKKMPEKLRQAPASNTSQENDHQTETYEPGAITHNALGQVKTQAEFQNVPVNLGNRMIVPRVRKR